MTNQELYDKVDGLCQDYDTHEHGLPGIIARERILILELFEQFRIEAIEQYKSDLRKNLDAAQDKWEHS